MASQDLHAADRAEKLSAGMRLGAAVLEVADLGRSGAFYEQAVGLRTIERSSGRAALGGAGGQAVLRLIEKPGARPKPRSAAGLFHLAFLLPERRDLATIFARLASRGQLTGASDHLVSEALYLDDPDGLGVEIYWDRPRAEWPVVDGKLQMATDPIDRRGLLELVASDQDLDAPAPANTVLGHVHLQAGDLVQAETFWIDALGLDRTTTYPGATFMSAGGYHHHVAANVWSSRGQGAAGEDVARLKSFEMILPTEDDVAATAERLARAGVSVGNEIGGVSAADPWGSTVVLRVA